MAANNVKVVKNADGTYRGPQPQTFAEKMAPKVKWATNTIVGTAKGVVIATAVSIAASAVDSGLRKGLKHN